jgi:hypothetical protein
MEAAMSTWVKKLYWQRGASARAAAGPHLP